MIPTKPDMQMIRDMVERIKAVYLSGNKTQIEQGNAWYRVAHDLAEQVGHGNVRLGAGIIAAFSAQKRWGDNLDLAFEASNGNVRGHTSVTLAKVQAMLDGASPESVLPMDLKTGMFYRCIIDPSDPDPVVIDRWAYRTATGEYDAATGWKGNNPGLSNKNRYAAIALAYRMAAVELNDIAQRVQARCWVIEKDREDNDLYSRVTDTTFGMGS